MHQLFGHLANYHRGRTNIILSITSAEHLDAPVTKTSASRTDVDVAVSAITARVIGPISWSRSTLTLS